MGDESDTALIDELERRLGGGDVDKNTLTSKFWEHMSPDADQVNALAEDSGFIHPEDVPDTSEIIRQLSRIVYGGSCFIPADFRELLRQLGIYSQHA